jgi:hypothetical protein
VGNVTLHWVHRNLYKPKKIQLGVMKPAIVTQLSVFFFPFCAKLQLGPPDLQQGQTLDVN